MEKNQIDKARASGAVDQEGAGASILESLNAELTQTTSPPLSPVAAETDSLLIDYASALCSGYRSLSEAAINHFAGLRTDNEHSVRQALKLAGAEYYERLCSILSGARMMGLINSHSQIDLSLDHWHVPYQGEKLIQHYGYHYNGMMNRAFPGIHPMTAYDLTDKCFILITPPSAQDNPADVTAREGLSLCEKLGFTIKSVRADRGESTVEFLKGISEQEEDVSYYLGVKANSILRKHARGRGWVENEKTGERACLRRNLDYHGVKTNLIALSKRDRKHPSKRRMFLFTTNDSSSTDPFVLLQQYRMRGEHERRLGCLTALGVKHLPSTDSTEEIGGHLLLFTKLHFLFKLFCKKLGIKKKECEPKTLANLFLRKSGMSWFDDGEGERRTIIFANRAIIKKIGRTKIRFDDGHEVTLIEQWRSRSSSKASHSSSPSSSS